jgi:hypothetical protein
MKRIPRHRIPKLNTRKDYYTEEELEREREKEREGEKGGE